MDSSSPRITTYPHALSMRSDSMPDILWLDDAAARDTNRVGAKAAHLSRLAQLHQVPPGFCLTADAHQTRTLSNRVSANLRASIAHAYQQLADRCGIAEPSVAVRSSAIDEDGPLASFAGQHETYLNIRGVANICEAVECCWASAHTEQVLAYRQRHNLSVDGIRIAVLIQQLVPADVSAVLFSINPVTCAQDEMVLTASWGLGESIAGGTVTPDTWTISKLDQTTLREQIALKQRMTVAMLGGVREIDVPRLMRTQPSLGPDRVREIADLGLTLERHVGWPVDLELAYAAGTLYLLQCRPITTIAQRHSIDP
ncbi:MAG: PEP/pyruvate-binding domain-containing protein [Thermomicrobiales bacterium]|nr:PEP/pyruvate-binding domain-containing protein [Thermomicrobiales bacterium]